MNRIGKHLVINIENPLLAGFVIPAHLRIAVTIQAIFRIRNRLCFGPGNTGEQEHEKNKEAKYLN